MESLMHQVTQYNDYFTTKELCIDLKKLNNDTLLRISESSKLTQEDFVHAFTADTDDRVIKLLEKIIFDPDISVSLKDLKSIEFDKFSDSVHQNLMSSMLRRNSPRSIIYILLDKMRSVNYGKERSYNELNPLIHCCLNGKFALVRSLVERYGADIEYSVINLTPIMFSAKMGYKKITKYLYNRGALIDTDSIISNSTPSIRRLIVKLEMERIVMKQLNDLKIENEKLKSDLVAQSETNKKYDELKLDYQQLKSENDIMKLNKNIAVESRPKYHFVYDPIFI